MRARAQLRWTLGLVLAQGLLFGCGVQVDHTPQGNLLDAATADCETGAGHWAAWYGTAVACSREASQHGGASLGVQILAPFWGVFFDNYPGQPAAPGVKDLELWSRAGSGTDVAPGVRVRWRDSAGADLKVDAFTLPTLSPTWTHFSATPTAPPGTAYAFVEITGTGASAGESLFLDEMFLGGSANPP